MKKKTEPSDEYSLKLIQENYYSPSLTKRKINLCFRTRLVTPLSPMGDCTKLVSRRLRGGSFEKQALSLTFDYLFLYDMVTCLCVRGLIPEKRCHVFKNGVINLYSEYYFFYQVKKEN